MGIFLSCCRGRDYDRDSYYYPQYGQHPDFQLVPYHDPPPVPHYFPGPAPAEYWQDWLRLEKASLPIRKHQFDSRLDTPFVQITRDHAAMFYDLDIYEMNQVLPRRPFVHYGVHGNAYEHRAVRRMAYFKLAYLTGYHGNEEQMYMHGRNVFNQRLDAAAYAAAARGERITPITLFMRNNMQSYNYQYTPLQTDGDLRAHERYD